jgi:hypothetical protein
MPANPESSNKPVPMAGFRLSVARATSAGMATASFIIQSRTSAMHGLPAGWRDRAVLTI